MYDTTYRETQKLVYLAHPFGVAFSQIVVHSDDVYTLTFERIEIDRQCCDQGLALASLHFGNDAPMQDHATHELHIKMPLP